MKLPPDKTRVIIIGGPLLRLVCRKSASARFGRLERLGEVRPKFSKFLARRGPD